MSASTWGIKLGTQPYGAIVAPTFAIAIGDTLWFTPGQRDAGRLSKRRSRAAHRVVVTRMIDGYIMVDYR